MTYKNMINKKMIFAIICFFLASTLSGCSSEEETTGAEAKQPASAPQRAPERHILSNEQEILKQAKTLDGLIQDDAQKKKDAIDKANSEY